MGLRAFWNLLSSLCLKTQQATFPISISGSLACKLPVQNNGETEWMVFTLLAHKQIAFGIVQQYLQTPMFPSGGNMQNC